MDRYQSIRRECLDSPPMVLDSVVLNVTRFRLPGADLFPQVHHLVAYLPDSNLMLLTIRVRESLQRGAIDPSLN